MNYPSATHASRHLSWKELACKDAARTPYPLVWRQSRALPLAAEFERIRTAIGHKPIRILSGYRTEAHNRAIGGARASQHVEGRALDLLPPTGLTLDEFYRIVHGIAVRNDSRLRGLGRYGTFLHVDIRPKGEIDRVVAWRGERAWAELKTEDA